MLSIGSHHHARHRQGPSFDFFFFLFFWAAPIEPAEWGAASQCGNRVVWLHGIQSRQASVDELRILSACYENWFVKELGDGSMQRSENNVPEWPTMACAGP